MAATEIALEVDSSLDGQFLQTLHSFVKSSLKINVGSTVKLGDKTNVYEIAELLAKGSPVAIAAKEATEVLRLFVLVSNMKQGRKWVAADVSDVAAVNKALEPIVFVVSNKLSFADIALFIRLRPVTKKFSAEDRLKFCNITRYSTHLSHVVGGAAASFSAPTDAPSTAGKTAPVKGEKKAATTEKKATPAATEEAVPDIARVSFLVGKILSAEMHPSAESLYMEKIDLGEAEPRVVISGLKGKVPLESLPGKMVVCVANLKPAALRGIKSFAMVLAATGADGKVELVEPPAGAKPGDRVHPQGTEPKPDDELNPKKKIWETIQPGLVTDDKCVATFNGTPLVCTAGACTVPSVVKGSIK